MPPAMLAVVTGSWQSALVVKLKAAGWTRPFPATSVAPAPMATRYVVLQASRSLGLMASALPAGASVNVTPWSIETVAALSVAAFISSLKVAVMSFVTATLAVPSAGSLPASVGGTLSMT